MKKPHEMTWAEFSQVHGQHLYSSHDPAQNLTDMNALRAVHRQHVMDAVAAGVDVAAVILAEHFLLPNDAAPTARASTSINDSIDRRAASVSTPTRTAAIRTLSDLCAVANDGAGVAALEFVVEGDRYYIGGQDAMRIEQREGSSKSSDRLRIILTKDRRK